MRKHPLIVLILIGCVYYDKILIVCLLIYNQIIHGSALLIAHRAIPCLAIFHIIKIVGQDHLEIRQRILSLAQNLSHMGYIKQSCLCADCHMLFDYACWILYRKNISPKRHHLASGLYMRIIQRSL